MCAIYVLKISMTYLIQYIWNMSICDQYKIINEIYIHFLGSKSLNCVYFIFTVVHHWSFRQKEDKKNKFGGMYGDLLMFVFMAQHVTLVYKQNTKCVTVIKFSQLWYFSDFQVIQKNRSFVIWWLWRYVTDRIWASIFTFAPAPPPQC